MLTAATRREIAPIAMMNVVTVPSADVSVASWCRGIPDPDRRGLRVGVDLRVDGVFYVTDVVDIVDDDVHLGPLVFPAVLVSIPLVVHNDPVVR